MPEFKDTDELLKELGLPTIEEIQPNPSEQPALRRGLEEELQRILDADSDREEGGYKVKVKDRHIALSRSLWPLLKLTVNLYIDLHLPHGKMIAGRSLFEFFSKVRELVNKLDPTERLIYDAVAGVSKSKRLLNSPEKGASVEDLRERFRQEGQVIPATLEGDLKGMVDKGVLSPGPYYQVVF